MLKVFEEALPKIKFRPFWSCPLKAEMKFSKSAAPLVTTGSLNLKSVDPFFCIEESSQQQIGAIRCYFLIIDTLGYTEPAGVVKGEFLEREC